MKHWSNENLKSPAKSVNAPLIKEYTGVMNYKGRTDQIKKVMELFEDGDSRWIEKISRRLEA